MAFNAAATLLTVLRFNTDLRFMAKTMMSLMRLARERELKLKIKRKKSSKPYFKQK